MKHRKAVECFWNTPHLLRCDIDELSKSVLNWIDRSFGEDEYKTAPPDYRKVNKRARITVKDENGEAIYETRGDFKIRPSGNNSLRKPKRSVKIKLPKGNRFLGHYRRINFKSMWTDPSLLREFVVWGAAADLEIPAPRMHHALLYINKTFRGVFNFVENLDVDFLTRVFGDIDGEYGNFYKGQYRDLDAVDETALGEDVYCGADLAYRGVRGSDYWKNRDNNLRTYKLKIKRKDQEAVVYDDLARLITTVRFKPNENFLQHLSQVADLDSLFDYLALCAVVGSWDALACNANNWLVYDRSAHPQAPIFVFIPWDMDHTLGNDYTAHPIWEKADPFFFSPRLGAGARPLVDRVMADSAGCILYRQNLTRLMVYFEKDHWRLRAIDQQKVIREFAQRDFREVATGHTDPEMVRPWGPHAFDRALEHEFIDDQRRIAGLFPFMHRRLDYLEKSLK